VGAYLNGVQAAVLLVLAVMGAGLDAAMDGMVRRAGAAAVGAIAHDRVPPSFTSWGLAGDSMCGGKGIMRRKIKAKIT